MATGRTIDTFKDAMIVTYAALGNENGFEFEAWQFPDKTIQADGAGTVTLQGSLDGANWEPLKDTAGVAISIDATTQAAAVVLENPKKMRAVNTAASAKIVIICTR